MFEKLGEFWKLYVQTLRIKMNQLKLAIKQYKEEKEDKNNAHN